nr:glycoside hydrolase family 127 protein [Pedobacter sp. HDW13]
MDKDTAWAKAANFFWKTVVEHRTVAIGGTVYVSIFIRQMIFHL